MISLRRSIATLSLLTVLACTNEKKSGQVADNPTDPCNCAAAYNIVNRSGKVTGYFLSEVEPCDSLALHVSNEEEKANKEDGTLRLFKNYKACTAQDIATLKKGFSDFKLQVLESLKTKK